MAQTYTAGYSGITFAANKSMLSIFNGSGSGRIVRVYRAWVLNNQTSAVTGVLTTFRIERTSSQSGGTSITAVKHDTTNENLPAQVVIATGATITASGTLRTFIWSNDEAAVGTGTWDEFETLIPLCCVWDAGYGDSNVQPITLREGEGFSITHTGSTTVGNCDIFIEFTLASS